MTYRIIEYLVLGLIAGAIVNLCGSGGGTIVTPTLSLFLGFPAQIAVGTGATSNLFLRAISSLVKWKRAKVPIYKDLFLKLVILLGIPNIVGTFAVATNVFHLKARGIRISIGISAIFAAVLIIAKLIADNSGKMSISANRRSLIIAVFFPIIGFISGFTSIGLGAETMALLSFLYSRDLIGSIVRTDLLASCLILIPNVSIQIFYGKVNFLAPFLIALGGMISNVLLERFALIQKRGVFQGVLTCVLVIAGALLLR